MHSTIRVGLIADWRPEVRALRASPEALQRVGAAVPVAIARSWVGTETIPGEADTALTRIAAEDRRSPAVPSATKMTDR